MSNQFFIVMGVAGSGKSSLGAAMAQRLDWTLIEPDDHHPESNRLKMRSGIPLTDEDRAAWLDALVATLDYAITNGSDAVLLCSALKKRYRDVFRTAFPGARFVYLQIHPEQAAERVDARFGSHLFPPSLVPSQFAALESPEGEAGVMTVDATRPLDAICDIVGDWLDATAIAGERGVASAIPPTHSVRRA